MLRLFEDFFPGFLDLFDVGVAELLGFAEDVALALPLDFAVRGLGEGAGRVDVGVDDFLDLFEVVESSLLGAGEGGLGADLALDLVEIQPRNTPQIIIIHLDLILQPLWLNRFHPFPFKNPYFKTEPHKITSQKSLLR